MNNRVEKLKTHKLRIQIRNIRRKMNTKITSDQKGIKNWGNQQDPVNNNSTTQRFVNQAYGIPKTFHTFKEINAFEIQNAKLLIR